MNDTTRLERPPREGDERPVRETGYSISGVSVLDEGDHHEAKHMLSLIKAALGMDEREELMRWHLPGLRRAGDDCYSIPAGVLASLTDEEYLAWFEQVTGFSSTVMVV